jgi:hypothetical protein
MKMNTTKKKLYELKLSKSEVGAIEVEFFMNKNRMNKKMFANNILNANMKPRGDLSIAMNDLCFFN